MPRLKKEAPQEEPKEEVKAPEAPQAKVDNERVNVFAADRQIRNTHGVLVPIYGGFVRQYSLEQHGKDFLEKAKGFAKKVGGRYEFPILR